MGDRRGSRRDERANRYGESSRRDDKERDRSRNRDRRRDEQRAADDTERRRRRRRDSRSRDSDDDHGRRRRRHRSSSRDKERERERDRERTGGRHGSHHDHINTMASSTSPAGGMQHKPQQLEQQQHHHHQHEMDMSTAPSMALMDGYQHLYMAPQPLGDHQHHLQQQSGSGLMMPAEMMYLPAMDQGGGGGGVGLMAQQQQQQQPGAGMSSMELLAFLQGSGGGQQDMQQGPPPPPPPPPPMPPSNTSGGHHLSSALPAVEDFVPVVPRNLLNLVRGDAATNNNNNFSSNGAGPEYGSAAPSGAEGTMVALEAPKIAPEVERRAREARRAHISGFPRTTTAADLSDYFRLVIPDVRRVKTQREVRSLALAAGDHESEVREIPVNAMTDLDEIRDLTLNMAKSKPFAFIEVSLADLISEMVEESQRDPERFVFPASDGRSYPLIIRRPRDYEPLDGVDEAQVVMVGFHTSLGMDKLQPAFEQFGELSAFDVQGGMAYARFKDIRDAVDCRTDLHGTVLGGRMVAVLPLYDWLKCMCVSMDMPVEIEDDDPISGKAMLNVMMQAQSGGADGYTGDAASSGALVLSKAAEKIDHMKDLLMMSIPVPEVVTRLSATYPHLRSLYGAGQVPIFATRLLVLLNLFDEEELTLDSTYSQLLADIEEEVEKHGCVEELIVPRREGRPRQPDVPKRGTFETQEEEEEAFATYEAEKAAFSKAFDAYMDQQAHPIHGGFGRVFVLYSTVEEAAHAQQQIAGKLFGGRTVVTSFMYEDILRGDVENDNEGGSDAADAEAYGQGEPSATGEGDYHFDTNNNDNAAEEALEDLD